eukprot:CAMPEP_0119532542 /NCGR_PEP_ID=MMETSP1344-20130328/46051_1 /TAXON_ID=236787 /ORGANISM="Florenciella parvula, Strain CCMP2471" /LENGTH=34 /DNA_ID= /DNA_START= /DNA_END= /DNA_ORIENTATION=
MAVNVHFFGLILVLDAFEPHVLRASTANSHHIMA